MTTPVADPGSTEIKFTYPYTTSQGKLTSQTHALLIPNDKLENTPVFLRGEADRISSFATNLLASSLASADASRGKDKLSKVWALPIDIGIIHTTLSQRLTSMIEQAEATRSIEEITKGIATMLGHYCTGLTEKATKCTRQVLPITAAAALSTDDAVSGNVIDDPGTTRSSSRNSSQPDKGKVAEGNPASNTVSMSDQGLSQTRVSASSSPPPAADQNVVVETSIAPHSGGATRGGSSPSPSPTIPPLPVQWDPSQGGDRVPTPSSLMVDVSRKGSLAANQEEQTREATSNSSGKDSQLPPPLVAATPEGSNSSTPTENIGPLFPRGSVSTKSPHSDQGAATNRSDVGTSNGSSLEETSEVKGAESKNALPTPSQPAFTLNPNFVETPPTHATATAPPTPTSPIIPPGKTVQAAKNTTASQLQASWQPSSFSDSSSKEDSDRNENATAGSGNRSTTTDILRTTPFFQSSSNGSSTSLSSTLSSTPPASPTSPKKTPLSDTGKPSDGLNKDKANGSVPPKDSSNPRNAADYDSDVKPTRGSQQPSTKSGITRAADAIAHFAKEFFRLIAKPFIALADLLRKLFNRPITNSATVIKASEKAVVTPEGSLRV
ncbi:hypothetical protein JYU14_05375 [Simkania negevensis]|uniref:Uncharacterized protein n=1 Tax=Simkania negevensis TaxID=83561 RepID=A0ABS3ATN9_9BACT|nr:hypothetical protein [Simkania negevensis]